MHFETPTTYKRIYIIKVSILTETQARTNKNIPFGLAKITDLSKSYLNEIEKEKVSQNR
jgi:hypothetical protein